MDRIKDFFHDFSDVFFAIVITGVMFIVLSSNLGSWFDNSSNMVLADQPSHVSDNDLVNPSSEDDSDQANLENAEETNTEDKQIEEAEEIPVKETENVQVDDKKVEEVPESPVASTEVTTIVIPNGTPGSGVAKILKDNGLIEDTNDFIRTAENLRLAVRLKSGTFEIPQNTTIEDMVRIIAGQKR